MTSIPERETIIQLIQQANTAGARLERACEEAGISLRTYRRWYQNGKTLPDKRPEAVRPEPANKLTPQEREKILELCNQPEYSQQPPSQIVPDLLDQGIYVASESSFYRVLKEADSCTIVAKAGHHNAAKSRQPTPPAALVRCGAGILPTCRPRFVGSFILVHVRRPVQSQNRWLRGLRCRMWPTCS